MALSDDVQLRNCDLGMRTSNALRAAGFETVGEVRKALAADPYALLDVPNLGKKSLRQLELACGVTVGGALLKRKVVCFGSWGTVLVGLADDGTMWALPRRADQWVPLPALPQPEK